MARFTDANAARAYLDSLSEHRTRLGDTSSLNPEFAIRMANAISQAREAGIPATFMSGYREGSVTGSRYDVGGYSSHGYGIASDVGGIGGAGSDTARRWNQIAQANGLHNPYLGTGSEGKEWNHWQLEPFPLEQTPDLLSRLRTAKASGDMGRVWAAEAGLAGGPQVASLGNTPVAVPQAPSVPGTTLTSTPSGFGVYGSLANIESNNRNIPSTVDKDYPGQPGSKSQGYFQIDTPTWQQFGAKAGIDLNQYPNAMSAPREVQQQVVGFVPLSRFGGRTLRMLGQQYGPLDKSMTVAQLNDKYGGGAPGTTINTTGPDTSLPYGHPARPYTPSQSYTLTPDNPPTVGTTPTAAPATAATPATPATDATAKPEDKPKSTAEKLADVAKSFASPASNQPAALPEDAKLPTFQPVPDTTAQMYGPAQQLFNTVLASSARPLSWSSRPFGYQAGPQMGTTLNTTDPYGGQLYG